MQTQTLTAPVAPAPAANAGTIARDWSVTRPFVVGVDDTKEAYPALKYATELSLVTGSRVHLVSALKPFHGVGAGSPGEQRTAELRLELREVFLEDLLPTVVTPPVWTRIAKIGDPADVLAEEAHGIRAGMILIGAGRHGTVERILSRPTALRVIQKTDLPIVVVPRGSTPPSNVVVGADFSPASKFACQVAIEMLGGKGTLHLVNVQPLLPLPGEVWSVDLSKWEIDGTMDRIGEYEPDPALYPDIRVERVSLSGDIASTLEKYAASVGADLIAVGSHGYNLAQRAMLGSVSAALLSRPMQAVLVTRATET
ncbi:MAG TPA: universal stress protein [Gemmatimonadaceae bacterium]|nr:universal stress protein [Gemmatimonadaceae bacterium]